MPLAAPPGAARGRQQPPRTATGSWMQYRPVMTISIAAMVNNRRGGVGPHPHHQFMCVAAAGPGPHSAPWSPTRAPAIAAASFPTDVPMSSTVCSPISAPRPNNLRGYPVSA
jgi:hypothetical protein